MWRTAARENTAIPQAEGFPGTWTELLLDIQVIRFFVIFGSPTHVNAMAIQIINMCLGSASTGGKGKLLLTLRISLAKPFFSNQPTNFPPWTDAMEKLPQNILRGEQSSVHPEPGQSPPSLSIIPEKDRTVWTERIPKAHLIPPCAVGRNTFYWTGFSQAPSNQDLKTS